MLSSISLQHPAFLLLLLFFFFSEFLHKEKRVTYIMPHFYDNFSSLSSRTDFTKYFLWLMIFFALLALSNPTQTLLHKLTKPNAIDIVLSIDTSGSMSSYGFGDDYYKSRLDVVKNVVRDFIAKRNNDRIGLLFFGTNTAIASPLSFEKESQFALIKKVRVGSLGKSTALLDSLIASMTLLKDSSSASKIVILLSDGEDTSSKTPLEVVLAMAKKYHIKIYTISIDTAQSNRMELIAKESKSKSFHADKQKDLEAIYQTINKLETSKVEYKTLKVQETLFYFPLSLSLFFGFLALVSAKKEF